jgi:hypothetical protein
MTFARKTWHDSPQSDTPEDAIGLNDLEARIANGLADAEAYAETVVAGAGGALGAPAIRAGGNLGAAYTLTLAAAETWLTGILDDDCEITLAQATRGKRFWLFLVQGGAGANTLSIDDGSGAQPIPVPQAIGDVFQVQGSCDGTNVYVGLIGAV